MFCLEYFQNIGNQQKASGNNSVTNTWSNDFTSCESEACESQQDSYIQWEAKSSYSKCFHLFGKKKKKGAIKSSLYELM